MGARISVISGIISDNSGSGPYPIILLIFIVRWCRPTAGRMCWHRICSPRARSSGLREQSPLRGLPRSPEGFALSARCFSSGPGGESSTLFQEDPTPFTLTPGLSDLESHRLLWVACLQFATEGPLDEGVEQSIVGISCLQLLGLALIQFGEQPGVST